MNLNGNSQFHDIFYYTIYHTPICPTSNALYIHTNVRINKIIMVINSQPFEYNSF